MNYYCFQILTDSGSTEFLMAWLSNLPFDSFLETENGLDAYIREDLYDPSVDEQVADLQDRFAFTWKKTFIPGENWNETWESNFHPVVVDDFVGIRAGFHPPIQDVSIELVITPKMAFGTGHHETTFMMVQLMRDLDFSGKKVLDYGCGTGILAILASKLGASHVDAVDIEVEAFTNTLENAGVNEVDNIQAYHGTLDVVPHMAYSLILANINRNVILESLPALVNRTQGGSIVLLSGFVSDDEEIMAKALPAHGFDIQKILRRQNWLAMQCLRK